MLTALFQLVILAAQPGDWSVVKDQDGVRVSQRPSAGNDLVQFRAETQLDAPIVDVVAALLDFQHRPEWVPNCGSTVILDRPQPHVAIVYSYTQSPPLIADRDVVFEARTTIIPSDDSVEISFHGVQDARKPPIAGVTRIVVLEGKYLLHRVDAHRTAVTYEFMADLGGNLPAFVVNAAGKDMPYKTLLGLRGQLARGRHPEAVTGMEERLQWRGFEH